MPALVIPDSLVEPVAPAIPLPPTTYDAAFERRWTRWLMAGRTSERRFTRRVRIVAAVAIPLILALAALIARGGW